MWKWIGRKDKKENTSLLQFMQKKKKKRKNDGGLTEIISAEIEKCKQIQDIF